MMPLIHRWRPAQLRADIAHPPPGRYRLLRTDRWPHPWLVAEDSAAATGDPQIGGR